MEIGLFHIYNCYTCFPYIFPHNLNFNRWSFLDFSFKQRISYFQFIWEWFNRRGHRGHRGRE